MTRDEILALEPGPELEAAVARDVLDEPFRRPSHGPCYGCTTCGQYFDECLCGLSEDMNMAWLVVEVMQKPPYSHECYLSSQSWGWDCIFSNPGDKGGSAHGDSPETPMTAPEAVCKAALLAVMEASH